ncbi:MAG: YidC/Oxa1 family membrane protein insertase [Patescibacteria group bacterium]
MSYLYHTFFYDPLYNGLIFLINTLPQWADFGVAIVVFTVIVKLILFPLSRKAVLSQMKMKELEPRINELKAKYKDPAEQSMQTMKLYKESGINPFSSILLIFIQIPIILALYQIFYSGGLPKIDASLLYSFIHSPELVTMKLWFIDITKKSWELALLAAITQFFQIKYSMPVTKKDPNVAPSFGTDLAHAMSTQMKYVLPVIVFFASYSINAGIAIYWTTSNVFAIGQELFIRRKK